MKKIRIALIAVGAVLLALPPMFGFVTESQVRERVESLNADGALLVAIESFDRGWFTSTARLTVAPPGSGAPSTRGTRDPMALLFDRPLDVRVDFSHGPVSLRDGFFVGTSEFIARPADGADDAAPAGSAVAATDPYRFEFHGQATFSGEVHFLAILPPLDRDSQAGALSFSGGRLSGTVGGRTIKANGEAATLRITSGPTTLSVQGITASADNEILSRYLVPGVFELAIERASIDIGPAGPLRPGASAFDATGVAFRTDVRLDEQRNLLDSTASLGLDSARFGADTRITTGRLNVAATRLDAAALEAASRRLEQSAPAQPTLDELAPLIERLLEAGPSVTVNPLRFDVNGAPFEATLHAEASPSAASGPADLRQADSWLSVLSGRAEITAEKELVERIATAAVKTQLASQYEGGSSVPFEALDTMAEAQAGLVLAMLAAQGIVEDRGTVYRTELRLADGALTINGRPLPLDLL